jgi:uncharacterized membrane protein
MESKAKFLGHPLHPILIVFPLGLLVTSVIFDLLSYFSILGIDPDVGFWMAVSGIIGGVGAAIFGLIDWIAIPAQTRAKSIGLFHAFASLILLILFALSAVMRSGNVTHAPGLISIVLSICGLTISMLGGWLGGELVHRLNVSNDTGANLNAPNSLTGRL